MDCRVEIKISPRNDHLGARVASPKGLLAMTFRGMPRHFARHRERPTAVWRSTCHDLAAVKAHVDCRVEIKISPRNDNLAVIAHGYSPPLVIVKVRSPPRDSQAEPSVARLIQSGMLFSTHSWLKASRRLFHFASFDSRCV